MLTTAYQTEPLLERFLLKIPNYITKVLLVWDDPDKAQIERISNLKINNLIIKARSKKMGVGAAIMEGINYALVNEYNILVTLAGNGKDDPTESNLFIDKVLEGYDYVQGSRWIDHGVSENLPKIRYLIVKSLALIWSIVLRKRITEVTNGYRGYNVNIFRNEKLFWNIKNFMGYELEYYLNYAIIREGFKHTEVGVSKKYKKNVTHSKIKLKHAFQILAPIFKMPILHSIYVRQLQSSRR